MSLNRNTVNPLSVLGLRKLRTPPEHFVKLKVNLASRLEIGLIENWINFNLNGRYSIAIRTSVIENNISEYIEIGFEEPSDRTLMTLGCPHLHNKG